jgi:hypothetical protein
MNIFKRIALAFDNKAAEELVAIRKARKVRAFEKHEFEYCFSATGPDGKTFKYYCFKDPINRPPRRHANWILRLDELRMGMKRENLLEFVMAIKEVMAGGKQGIDLNKLYTLIGEIHARIEFAPYEDQMYYLAAAEFFTLDETLDDFVFHEQEAKIEIWKHDKNPADFFLQKPLSELIGFKFSSKGDLESHLKVTRLINLRQDQILKSLRKGG